MKIIAINDCDWWIGESLDACVTDFRTNIESDPIYSEDACELTDDELDTFKIFIADEDDLTGEGRTFREQMAIEIHKGGQFPRIFASTEY